MNIKNIDNSEIMELINFIYIKYNHDFRNYVNSSMQRRILYALRQFNINSVSELMVYISQNSQNFFALLNYLTVPVSAMFRDPSYYLAFRKKIIPLLKTYPSPRIWVAGCSNGEEVYSLAICLKEEELLQRTLIYATDINPVALENAERGIFKVEKIQQYTEGYHQSGGKAVFSDNYHAAYGNAVFERSLRKNIVFSEHSLATDSVFSETQFISCRNVLIYFDRELQNRSFDLFYESLCRKGFLGLGNKETTHFYRCSDGFNLFDKSGNIFRKNR